jgi:hypothetical protein
VVDKEGNDLIRLVGGLCAHLSDKKYGHDGEDGEEKKEPL